MGLKSYVSGVSPGVLPFVVAFGEPLGSCLRECQHDPHHLKPRFWQYVTHTHTTSDTTPLSHCDSHMLALKEAVPLPLLLFVRRTLKSSKWSAERLGDLAVLSITYQEDKGPYDDGELAPEAEFADDGQDATEDEFTDNESLHAGDDGFRQLVQMMEASEEPVPFAEDEQESKDFWAALTPPVSPHDASANVHAPAAPTPPLPEPQQARPLEAEQLADEDALDHGPEQREVRRQVQQQSHEWGPFRLTWKAPGRNRQPGGWQATCRYHAQSDSVRCTKTLSVMQQGAEEATLNLVKQWCIQASLHTRKDSHCSYNPRFHPALVPEAIEAAMLRLPPPPERLVTDQEQDADGDVAPEDLKKQGIAGNVDTL